MTAPLAADRATDVAPVLLYLRDSFGLRFEGQRALHVEVALRDLIRHSSARGIADFLARVRQDPDLRQQLIAAVTVGETYFFRGKDQLDVLSRKVLPALRSQQGPGVQVWSAGCATGEEAYTLAMLLDDADMAQAHVVATDLSAAALRVARAGSYRPWSVRGMDAKARLAAEPGGYRVPEQLRRRVQFRELNLVTDMYPVGCDLIMCRNVLLYLTPAHVEDVARGMVDALAPGGWIVTAATDPDLGLDDVLRRVPTEAGLMYRKPAPEDLPDRRVIHVRDARPRTMGTHPSSSHGSDRRRAEQSARHAATPPVPPAAETDDAQAAAVAIRRLADSGDVEQARQAAVYAIQRFALDPELRCVHAEVLMATARYDEAVKQASAAVYLDARSPMAHLMLGRAQLGAGGPRAAARALRSALDLLQNFRPDTRVACGDGMSAGELAGYAESYLRMASEPDVAR